MLNTLVHCVLGLKCVWWHKCRNTRIHTDAHTLWTMHLVKLWESPKSSLRHSQSEDTITCTSMNYLNCSNRDSERRIVPPPKALSSHSTKQCSSSSGNLPEDPNRSLVMPLFVHLLYLFVCFICIIILFVHLFICEFV